jgi:hypothetical protein
MANDGTQEQQQEPGKPNGNGGTGDKPKRDALAMAPITSDIASPFSSGIAFGNAQRMATSLAASSLVPKVYLNNVANCLIAMELAARVGVSVLMVMQNLDVIQGKPSWSSKFLIASVNASGRFTPIRYEWAGAPGKDEWACRAHAVDKASGELCVGTWITWLMAKKEGWATKSGSKWQTMPEQMFQYRAAAFWTRTYCPEISIGFHTSDELEDAFGKPGSGDLTALPGQLSPGGAQSLEAVLGLQRAAADAPTDAEIVDEDGVVHEAKPAAAAAATRADKPTKAESKAEQSKLPNT